MLLGLALYRNGVENQRMSWGAASDSFLPFLDDTYDGLAMLNLFWSRLRRWNVQQVKPLDRVRKADLQLSLGDLNLDVARSLAEAFADVAAVEVVCGNLLDLNCDAIVSPANSFGDMGGGIDKAIDAFHGGQAQPRVMEAIRQRFLGELPVGMATIVEMPTTRFRAIVVAPTMRIPGRVTGTIHAYLAMRAALVAVIQYNQTHQPPIRSLAIPGLATGVGGLGFEESAKQLRVAYDNIIGGGWQQVQHAAQAPYVLAAPERHEESP
jgi:O-acetyl-ADP-ribose deacetylase (regulator of RNase III)